MPVNNFKNNKNIILTAMKILSGAVVLQLWGTITAGGAQQESLESIPKLPHSIFKIKECCLIYKTLLHKTILNHYLNISSSSSFLQGVGLICHL